MAAPGPKGANSHHPRRLDHDDTVRVVLIRRCIGQLSFGEVMTIRIWRPDGQLDGLRRTGGETRDLLKAGAISPTVELYPRSDGPGSSQDLLQFAAMGSRVWKGTADLHDPAWSWSNGALRTPGACIGSEPIRLRAVPAPFPSASA